MRVKINPRLIDLRHFGSSSGASSDASNNSLIIDQLSKLVDHITRTLSSLTGEERKNQGFRITALKKAITAIRDSPIDIQSGRHAQSLKLKGVGKGTCERIDEILTTGSLHELQTSDVPVSEKAQVITALTEVTGIGEAHATKFYDAGVRSVEDLEVYARQGKISLTHHMMIGLKYYRDFQTKIPYDEIVDVKTHIGQVLTESFPQLIFEVAGSHRRQQPVSGDIDMLITHPDIVTEDQLIQSPIRYLKSIVQSLERAGILIDHLTTLGDTKYMGVCSPRGIGRRIDLRFVPYQAYYPALLYFTGSMTVNKLMRTIALEKGYTLNEYGLYRLLPGGTKGECIRTGSEEEIFSLLGIVYLTPAERQIDG